MNMTHAQRLILSNQYEILSKLNPERADYYKKCQTIIERGYCLQMLELEKEFGHLSEETCREVLETLEMYHALKVSYENLPADERQEIAPSRIEFIGYSKGHRITSYNVCYTKLLRTVQIAFLLQQLQLESGTMQARIVFQAEAVTLAQLEFVVALIGPGFHGRGGGKPIGVQTLAARIQAGDRDVAFSQEREQQFPQLLIQLLIDAARGKPEADRFLAERNNFV